MTNTPEDLARALADAEYPIILTGAGISTESGVPDFRSKGGLWERYDPMVAGSLDMFIRDPKYFWEYHRPRYEQVAAVEPNAAHHAVAELQRRGIVKSLITQNIDGLHGRAGSENPIEIHGSLTGGRCLRCDLRVTRDELLARADDSEDGVPRCNCGFQLKSHVVLFGEMLPADAMERMFEEAERADMILVIGSSLVVSPVADIPAIVLQKGGTLAILTESETPYDRKAHVRLHTKAGETLPLVVAEIDRRTTAQ
jgi:NAD-dependent deacetylase